MFEEELSVEALDALSAIFKHRRQLAAGGTKGKNVLAAMCRGVTAADSRLLGAYLRTRGIAEAPKGFRDRAVRALRWVVAQR